MASADQHVLSRDFARLMLVMRRMIKQEFSVTIHLDSPDAGQELLAYARLSAQSMLKEMAIELETMLDETADHASPELAKEPPDRDVCYRGVPVNKAVAKEGDGMATEVAARIYRGRRV